MARLGAVRERRASIDALHPLNAHKHNAHTHDPSDLDVIRGCVAKAKRLQESVTVKTAGARRIHLRASYPPDSTHEPAERPRPSTSLPGGRLSSSPGRASAFHLGTLSESELAHDMLPWTFGRTQSAETPRVFGGPPGAPARVHAQRTDNVAQWSLRPATSHTGGRNLAAKTVLGGDHLHVRRRDTPSTEDDLTEGGGGGGTEGGRTWAGEGVGWVEAAATSRSHPHAGAEGGRAVHKHLVRPSSTTPALASTTRASRQSDKTFGQDSRPRTSQSRAAVVSAEP